MKTEQEASMTAIKEVLITFDSDYKGAWFLYDKDNAGLLFGPGSPPTFIKIRDHQGAEIVYIQTPAKFADTSNNKIYKERQYRNED